MRSSVPILLLLSLAACQDRNAASAPSEATEAVSVPSDEELLRNASDPVRVEALLERAMSTIPDAASARYRNVRPGAGGAVCGEVSLKSTPFRPFVVTPEAVAVIAATPALAFNDPSDLAADAWIRWCATPEELGKLQSRLSDPALTLPDDANVTAAAEPPAPPLAEPGASPPAAQLTPKAPARPAPPPQIDSFFNSVQRSGE